MFTYGGQSGILAHVDFNSDIRVGKYYLDLCVLDELGVGCLLQALREGKSIFIDEIGPMELKSLLFRETVQKVFDQDRQVLATIVLRDSPFTKALKLRHDVTLFEVKRENQENLIAEVLRQLQVANT